jgi:hypothetical protein
VSTSRKSRSSVSYVAGSFEWAETILAHTGRLTPEQIAAVLENNPDRPLTRTLKHYLLRLKRRDRLSGVKPRNAAAWEFILFDAKALYEAELEKMRKEPHPGMRDADCIENIESPDERAYRAVVQEIQSCHIDCVTLSKLLSLHDREPTLFFAAGSQPGLFGSGLAA